MHIGMAMSIAVVIAAIGAFYYTSNAFQTSTQLSNGDFGEIEDKNVQKPNEIIRTGIPILNAYEFNYVPSLSYYEIKEGQYDFLDRAVQKGTTLLSKSEMDQYFNSFTENGFTFAITSNAGETKYYRILYNEPPLSLDGHYVNVFVFVPEDPIPAAKTLANQDVQYLGQAVDNPYTWTPIDEKSALALKTRIAIDGNAFTIPTKNGIETARLMYIGAFSEELNLPEFQAMYNLTATAQGGQ